MTLSHGAGVDWPGPRTMTYSRPSLSNPPSPLKNSSSGRRRTALVVIGGDGGARPATAGAATG